MSILLCSGCGVRVATIRDTRFGLAPVDAVCPRCARPAFWGRPRAG